MATGGPLTRCLIGFAGGLLGGLAMNAFARAIDGISHGQEGAGAAAGRDRVGRGVQPPQAAGPAEDDAAVRVATRASRALTGRTPSLPVRLQLGSAAHYAFSGVLGVCYALVAARAPAVRAGQGSLYGLAVWLVADEMVMPALGLSRGPHELPVGIHVYALTGHLVYGLTLESATRSWFDQIR